MDYSELKKLHVVFAEDDDEVRKFVATLFEDFFASLTLAKDGIEAYESIKTKKPDILITDIMMPKLNGLELIKKLDEGKIRPPIVFIATAYSETNFFLDSIRLKVDGYVLKPINVKELFAQIIEVVKKLKLLGFIIEMDDFGSGYSSLNMLNELPIDILKLDMGFVQGDLSTNSNNILSFII